MKKFKDYINEQTINEGLLSKVKDFLLDAFPIYNEIKMDKIMDGNRNKTIYSIPKTMKFIKKDAGFLFYLIKDSKGEKVIFIETSYENEAQDFMKNYIGRKGARLILKDIEKMSKNGITPWYIVELEFDGPVEY